MRRDRWIVLSSVFMLALCALPYGCGGKAVDDQSLNNHQPTTPVTGDGIYMGGDGRNYTAGYIAGRQVGGDGSGGPIDTCDFGSCGDGVSPPIADGESYGDGYDGEPDWSHDGVLEGEPVAEGAPSGNAADGWGPDGVF